MTIPIIPAAHLPAGELESITCWVERPGSPVLFVPPAHMPGWDIVLSIPAVLGEAPAGGPADYESPVPAQLPDLPVFAPAQSSGRPRA